MNEYFAQTLASVLEETSTNMGNAMVLNHLSKNGTVTLEEAEFYHNLCTDVITEATEDFIPDEIEVPEQEEALPPIELFDAVGNKYVFQDGELVPVDGEPEEEMAPEEAPEMEPEEAPAAEAPAAEESAYQESEELPVEESEVTAEVVEESETEEVVEESETEEAPVVEESEVVAEESEILEESSTVVARILANLK